MGNLFSKLGFGHPLTRGASLEVISETWGPGERQGRAWLMMGGKGAKEMGGHFALFIDVGGHSAYGESSSSSSSSSDLGGEHSIPTVFAGILLQLGLFENADNTKRMRIAYPISQAFDGVRELFDPTLCEKIIPLGPKCENIGMEKTPRQWAYGIESCAMDVYHNMISREGTDDPTDVSYEKMINEELEKANWKERVDFSTPKEFQSQRWDEILNSHTFISNLVKKMGLTWPSEIPVTPNYSGWLIDTIIAAPGRKSSLNEDAGASKISPIGEFINRPGKWTSALT